MKTVILAGGRGTRLMDETHGVIPKPMLEVGGAPMLEHIMRIYASQKCRDFVVAAGYKADAIHLWFDEKKSDLFARHGIVFAVEDTGLDTQTGGRLARLAEKGWLDDRFMMTYGDGMADVNLNALLDFHANKTEHGALVTLTAVNPPSRFGSLDLHNGFVESFGEKTQVSGGWINGGFYVVEPEALNLINGDQCRWEYEVLPVLAMQGKLAAYQHPGFFQMCDTWRDLQRLNDHAKEHRPPWLRFEINDKGEL